MLGIRNALVQGFIHFRFKTQLALQTKATLSGRNSHEPILTVEGNTWVSVETEEEKTNIALGGSLEGSEVELYGHEVHSGWIFWA